MNPESIRRVETELEVDLPDVIEILEQQIDREDRFIADELEHNLATLEYATILDQVLTDTPTDESWRVIYRSIHFAATVSGLLECGRAFDLADLAEIEPGDLRDHILDITQTYMGRNASIDSLTGAFMPELDPSGEYGDIAETVVALSLLQLERGAEAAVAAKMVEEWSGTID